MWISNNQDLLQTCKKSMCLSASLLLSLTVVFSPVESVHCPKQNQSAEPRFTTELGSVDYVRLFHSIHVLCCAEGYKDISWYKNVKGKWQPFPPPPLLNNDPEVLDNGQVLLFSDIDTNDSATYRCEVHGQSKSIYHDTKINVVECDKLARGPYMVDPVPEDKIIYDYGGTVTFNCTGYFGCMERGDGDIVLWVVEGSSQVITNIDSRYIVNQTNDYRPDKQTLGATLTINSVRKEDVDRTFTCILASPQTYDGQVYKKVRIIKKEKPLPTWELVLITVSSSVIFIVFIIVLIVCLRHLYGPQIRLFCSSRLDLFGPKTIENKEIDYNLFIYHAEDDETKAQEIKDYLKNKGYKVFIAADMQGNENIMHQVFEKTKKSALAVFLYSKALKEDDLANFFLQSMIRSRKGKRILILEVEAYKPKQIQEWQEIHAENIRVLQEQYNNLHEDLIDDNVNHNTENNVETDADPTEEIVDDLQFWKVLPRIKVPKSDEKGRKVTNFWCALQNMIPKFPYQKQKSVRKRQHSSIERPLLNSIRESETLTPLSIANEAREFSPSSDGVFTFEDLENRGNDPKDETNLNALAEKSNVRGELPWEMDENLIHIADEKDEKNPSVEGSPAMSHDVNHFENGISDKEEDIHNATILKDKDDIFTMSGEETRSNSLDSESGYGGENRSGRGFGYTSSEGGEIPNTEMLSSHSSGFSDGSFQSHLNKTEIQHLVNGTEKTGKLIGMPPGYRSNSASSESGYNTSPDRMLSNDSYLLQINENI